MKEDTKTQPTKIEPTTFKQVMDDFASSIAQHNKMLDELQMNRNKYIKQAAIAFVRQMHDVYGNEFVREVRELLDV